jgi:hypothetical protein
MEPVLRNYRHVFHVEGSNDFRGTDLIEHRPGTQIKHADALSRHVQTVTSSQPLSKEFAKAEQGTDKFCNSLEAGKPQGRSEYFYDGVTYRRRKNGEHQLVVPKKLVKDVIALNHDPIFAAHPGRKRTLKILGMRYYWPGMRQDVENYVRECDDCHRKPPVNTLVNPVMRQL